MNTANPRIASTGTGHHSIPVWGRIGSFFCVSLPPGEFDEVGVCEDPEGVLDEPEGVSDEPEGVSGSSEGVLEDSSGGSLALQIA